MILVTPKDSQVTVMCKKDDLPRLVEWISIFLHIKILRFRKKEQFFRESRMGYIFVAVFFLTFNMEKKSSSSLMAQSIKLIYQQNGL